MQTLRDLEPGELLDPHHVVGIVRLGHQRAERGDVDLDALVIGGAVVGAAVTEVVLAVLAGEPVARALVGREQRRCRTQLGDHVRDRGALGH